MRQFIYIIIGFFVILFVFMAVFYMIYPYIIRFIKYIYKYIYIEKWNKLSEEKKKCILVCLFIIFLIFGAIDVITNLKARYR